MIDRARSHSYQPRRLALADLATFLARTRRSSDSRCSISHPADLRSSTSDDYLGSVRLDDQVTFSIFDMSRRPSRPFRSSRSLSTCPDGLLLKLSILPLPDLLRPTGVLSFTYCRSVLPLVQPSFSFNFPTIAIFATLNSL